MMIECKVPFGIDHDTPALTASALEWCRYSRQFGAAFHLTQCPIHAESFAD